MSPLGRKSCGESGRLRDEPKLIKRLLLGAEFCVTYSKEEVFPAIPSSFFIVVDFLKVLIFFLVGYAILKDFSYCLARNSPVENSTSYVMTIDQ